MGALLPILAVLVAGVATATQVPTNAMLARTSGSVVLAALVSFSVGTAVLFALWVTLDRTSPLALRGAPGWAWLGGLYGAVFVSLFAFAAPRLGLATAITIGIAGQTVAALTIDHYGLLGFRVSPVSTVKLAGAALVFTGVILVRRG